MNDFFASSILNLDIRGYITTPPSFSTADGISEIKDKFKNHPSIIKIKEKIAITTKFSFYNISENAMSEEICSLNVKKPTTQDSIPAKILKISQDLCSPQLTDIFNNSINTGQFPQELKLAEISPVHKKDDKTNKENYRPISNLPSVSKILERIIY